jgi:hypothetical protein
MQKEVSGVLVPDTSLQDSEKNASPPRVLLRDA